MLLLSTALQIGVLIANQHQLGVLFVRGGMSDYIRDEDAELIEKIFPTAEVVTIDNASHWLHAEFPIEFIKIINDFVLG